MMKTQNKIGDLLFPDDTIDTIQNAAIVTKKARQAVICRCGCDRCFFKQLFAMLP